MPLAGAGLAGPFACRISTELGMQLASGRGLKIRGRIFEAEFFFVQCMLESLLGGCCSISQHGGALLLSYLQNCVSSWYSHHASLC